MPNIIHYVREYGSCVMKQMPFTTVDSLILTQLSYIKFSGIIRKNRVRYERGDITLREAARILREGKKEPTENLSSGILGQGEDEELLWMAAESRRFGSMKIRYYVNHIDEEMEMQFSAVTFLLEDGRSYVAFRGTDNHLQGWREDVKLAFGEIMPAQRLAQKYLEAVTDSVEGELYVGGHSKGGTLAAYSYLQMTPEQKNKIIRVYCFDNPQIYEMQGAREEKIIRILPKDSLVGLLFGALDNHIVVDSNQRGLRQHDPYSWQIREGMFVYLAEIGNRAWQKSISFNSLLEKLSRTEKEKVAQLFCQAVECLLGEKKEKNKLLHHLVAERAGLRVLSQYVEMRIKAGLSIRKKRRKIRLMTERKLQHISYNMGKNG